MVAIPSPSLPAQNTMERTFLWDDQRQNKQKTMATVYDFKLTDKKGQEVSLEEYKGKVLLIVNSATECGFTPQYDELASALSRPQSSRS